MNVAFIQVLSMFGIAFAISMFVAFIIKFIYKLLTSNRLSRFYDNEEMAKYNRARRIYKIHNKKINNSMQETEYYKNNELLNYYYNKNSVLKNA
jgi:hypothetical protein